MSTITIPLDPATEAALDEIAAATKRAKADIVADLLADYVRHAADLEDMVREARADVAAGRTFNRDEVAAGVHAIISAAEAKAP